MANRSRGHASFLTQSNALLRKNLTYQKRRWCGNVVLILFPCIFCLLVFALQQMVKGAENEQTNNKCGSHNSVTDETNGCPIPNPQEWPPLLQIPAPKFRAASNGFDQFPDLPNESCKRNGSCPVTVLITGNNQSLGEIFGGNMFMSPDSMNSSDDTDDLLHKVLGSESMPSTSYFYDSAFSSDFPIYYVQKKCLPNSTLDLSISLQQLTISEGQEVRCIEGLHLWRNSSAAVNDELYKGYHQNKSKGNINEILAAYDFLNSSGNYFTVSIWFNSTKKFSNDSTGADAINLLRVPRSVNLASNAYLQFLKGPGTKVLFEFVKEMPKPTSTDPNMIDISSFLNSLFFTWILLLLFPVILTSLVYDKEKKLRIMMKMHGLGDAAYWTISYAYFLFISLMYMLCLALFGSVLGLVFFRMNDYTIQFVFYFVYANFQISLAFLVAAFSSNVKTASVIAYILVFGSGLVGEFLFKSFIEDLTFPRGGLIALELYPGFSLYRGVYELSQYSTRGIHIGTGMNWRDLSDGVNGMKEVLLIMIVEWLAVLLVAYYAEKVLSLGSGRNPLICLNKLWKKNQSQGPNASVLMDKPDVSEEREKVDQFLLHPDASYSIICDNLKKMYPGKDGNPKKFAVRGLSLALPPGECFGLLGPNGAGKTSFLSMMIGLTKPSSGTAFVQGMDIQTHMDEIYTRIGVCPQHDLLWETLTGREHLLFYGRLKNLRGSALTQAIEDSLCSLNLSYGGVADKQAGKYSGGMKRRLSVAIALIGDPKVVYMDEPSTGLDPASKNSLWNVVKHAKQNRAIILTTHSMEEAEFLCDRLGIMANGSLQCIGNSKELKARYGGTYVFTMTTSSEHEEDVENLVRSLSINAKKIYHLSGTQKYELPKDEVRIADVYRAVEIAKSRFTVSAWGLTDTTVEDVFIKVAKGAQSFNFLT